MIKPVESMLESMCEQLHPLIAECGQIPYMIGIHRGGAWIAEVLHKRLALSTPLGSLDITFYRDDFSRIGLHPQINPSQLLFNLNDQNVILVDDVLYTGRTVRAAMNELFDYGRPARIILAVMMDRFKRELPIEANVCAQHVHLGGEKNIRLNGPHPLSISIVDTEQQK